MTPYLYKLTKNKQTKTFLSDPRDVQVRPVLQGDSCARQLGAEKVLRSFQKEPVSGGRTVVLEAQRHPVLGNCWARCVSLFGIFQ